jgi:pilus assembly protein Flp/PilA
MEFQCWSLYNKVQNFLKEEEGQDLIEYALVVALIAFAATAGMNTVATNINQAFTKIGSKVTATIT